jgi:hypothetical protein
MDQAQNQQAGLKQNVLETLRFIQQVLLDPASQFRHMPRQGGFIEPLISIATIGLLAGVLRILVTFYYMSQGASVSLFTALFAIVTTPLTVVIFCYIGAFLLSIIMRYLGADSSLEVAFRVTGYLAVISPIAVVAATIPYLGNLLILGLLTYLLVMAAIEVYQLNSNTAWMVFGIAFAILAVLSISAESHSPSRSEQFAPAAVEIEAPALEQPAAHH